MSTVSRRKILLSCPSNIPVADGGQGQSTGVLRPCVIGIRRKNSTTRFI